MTKHKMSNPQSFKRDLNKKGVTLLLLQEAMNCIGKQATARLFAGKSFRGGVGYVASASMENWIETLEYAEKNPDIPDTDPYQSRSIDPLPDWYLFKKLIETEIPESSIKEWDNMSTKQLGDEAIKLGITIGVRNSKAVKNLKQRMLDMYSRRQQLWKSLNDIDNNMDDNDMDEIEPDYRLMNVFKLRKLCIERGIKSNGLNKESLIEKLKSSSLEDIETYEDMTLLQLKKIAKDRGLIEYNNNNMTEIDKEAEKLETDLELYKYTTECVLYIAYIGDGMIKIGYSDGKLINRELKHQSSESPYNQWRLIKLFKISGRSIETIVHNILVKYRVSFLKQKEIYRFDGALSHFIKLIKDILYDNDLKLRVETLEKENMELKLRVETLEKEKLEKTLLLT